MARLSVVLVACALAGAAGCKKHGGGKGTGGGNGGDRAHADVMAIPGQVQLLVDGKVVANADRAFAATWAPIAGLLPPTARDAKTWDVLEVHTAGGRVTTMPEPNA